MNWLDGWLRDARGVGREFWKFYIAALCVDIGFAMYLFLYSLFLLDLGFDERQIGLVAGAMTIGAMVGTLPAGVLAERFGLRPILLTGFVMTPAICAVRPFFPSEHAQIGMAFLTGLFLCTWHMGYCPATAALTNEENRTFGFSMMFSTGISTGALAGLMGGVLPGWLMRTHIGLHAVDAKRVVLLLCCAIYALGIWPAWKLRLSYAGERRGPWRFDPFLYRYLPAIALWSLAAGAFVPFAQVFLAHQVRLPLVRIGEVFSAGQIVQVAAILLAPLFFRRCRLVAGIAYTQAVSGLALAGLAGAHGMPGAVTLYVAFMAIHWMAGPGIYSLLMDRVQESARSSASAANIFTTSLCQAIASAAAGAAYVHFGYPKVLGAIAAVAVFSSGWFWLLLRDRRAAHAVATATADAN
ncbi:MAG TPA: MFS transporter [Acidobacteriaceae bacterium]|nr:MFS transporter [Acidobacteriaceae bacterium]